MDSRGIYIIQTTEQFSIIIGRACLGENKEHYLKKAHEYITVLQEKEKGSENVQIIEQEEVRLEFWK